MVHLFFNLFSSHSPSPDIVAVVLYFVNSAVPPSAISVAVDEYQSRPCFGKAMGAAVPFVP